MAKYLTAVRYGMMAVSENFQSDIEGMKPGDVVIVKSSRGVDFGEIAGRVEELDREVKGIGEIIRVATENDLGIIRHIRENKEPEELSYCRQCVRDQRLQMRMVGVEHLFSSDKIVFYFIADGRVDFRELVKTLAKRYRTRIEMRQIGVRDESRLLADYSHCGRELCCRTFIKNLEPVTMRMAKVQKTTLDPSKISGHCGRLMCCLRFEDEVYTHLRKEFPGKGIWVVTPQFTGKVVGHTLLKQEVTVELASGDRETVHLSEILETRKTPTGPGRKFVPGENQQPEERDRSARPRDERGGRGERESRPRPEAPAPEPRAESGSGAAEESGTAEADAGSDGQTEP